jgi:UDP-3-O-[3-hydroxymyristoyl] glucosamine N-acyltransferase
MKLGEIADALGLPLEGEAALEIRSLAGLDDAGPGELSFAGGARYQKQFEASRASAFLLPPGFDALGRSCLRSSAPYVDFTRAIELFLPDVAFEPGVHPTAVIAPDAVLGEGVSVGAFSVIGARTRIGAGTRIHPHVVVYPDCEIGPDCEIHSGTHLRARVRLGSRVIVHNGAVLGSEGFGFAFGKGGRVRVPHRSGVEIDDDVEIGANTTIDASHPGHPRRGRATAATHVGRGVKIDNQVQVAHGCSLGEHTTLCAQVGLAGRTSVGKGVFFAGQSATSGDLHVADGTAVLGMSGVMSDTEPGAKLVGVPVMPRALFFRILAASKRLPDLLKRVARVEKRLGIAGPLE